MIARDRVLALGAVLVAVVAALLAARVCHVGSDYDDALITFRYAERLADGLGFTYNDGERVLGTSTPLWTLALAAAHALGVSAPRAADGLNVVLFALTAAALVLFLARASGRFAAAAGAVLFLVNPLHARAASYGMEAIAFCALLAVSWWAAAVRRPGMLGVAAGLAMVLRIEGALAAGAAFVSDRFRGRAWVIWVSTAVGLAAIWLVAATIYFGSPLPQSLSAKLLHTNRPDVGDTFRFLFLESPIRIAFSLLGSAGAIAVIARYPASGALRLPLWFSIAYTAFYLVGRPTAYEWYLPPLHLAIVALGAHVVGAVSERIAGSRRRPVMAACLVGGALAVAVMHVRVVRQAEAWTHTVEASYRDLTAWLNEHTKPTDTLYCGDIGYVGYDTGRRVLDAAALVSPSVLEARRDGRSANELLPELRPDVFVVPVQPGVFPVIWPNADTRRRYRPVVRVPDGPLEPSATEIDAYFRARGGWTPEYIVYVRSE